MFDIQSTLSFNKESLVPWNKYDYITRTSQNQWILQETWFVNEENINLAWNWSLWLLQMDFFYRHKPWYAGQFVRKIIPKIEIKNNSILFFSVILNQQKNKLLSVLVRDIDETFNNLEIQIPTINWKIDFEFMGNFIEEIEKERIERLNNYLEVTWLKDYNLTEKEKEVLADFENGKIEWGEFKIWDVFNINTYKKRFDANKINIWELGEPYVVRTALNNWIRGYINEDKQFLNEWNTISFWQDTATMFYQEKPYFTWDKIKILKSKNYNFNKINWLFFISTMTKSFSSFTWGSSSFSVWIIQNQNIQLPVKDNNPDYKLIETLISAVQKLVIKDVVVYTDNKKNKVI